jgi:threonine/homoserine/homoserine lactone efflux protein
VTIGMGLMMFAVAFGLGSVVLDRPAVLTAMKWAGAAMLLWLAWKITTATSGRRGAASAPDLIGFRRAAALQRVNPKSWLVCVSAAGTYLEPGSQGGDSALGQSASIGLLFILAAVPSCFVWLAFGATIQRSLRTNRSLRAFNVAMGATLAASTALIVV